MRMGLHVRPAFVLSKWCAPHNRAALVAIDSDFIDVP
jgi:hypothetical protein